MTTLPTVLSSSTSATAQHAPASDPGGLPRSQVEGLELAKCRIAARFGRLRAWEFWPSWAIYVPLIPSICRLAFRYGGLATCTAVNPAIPHGGIVGESKWSILSKLPPESIIPTEFLPPAPLGVRLTALERFMQDRAWTWPLILKPDVGQRGAGVRLIRTVDQAQDYLQDHAGAVLAQTYHPGPYEAGVFYCRHPGQTTGRIFSITDKKFPAVTGDGRSTLRSLIWRHPRYRLQASAYLSRLAERADDVPARGETVGLALAGNHCQGTMFLDGAHLRTPALLRAFDEIADRTPGFHFGRFDVRYTDPGLFMAGRGFQIVELNGLLSESTNIYDPGTTFWQAQRTLREQWRLAYQIGQANRARGAAVPALCDIWRTIREHLQATTTDLGSD